MIWIFLGFAPFLAGFAALVPYGVQRKRKHKYNEGTLFIAIVGLTLTLVALALTVGPLTGSRISCRNTSANVGLPYRWSISAGCLYRVDGRWLPRDEALRTVRILGLEP